MEQTNKVIPSTLLKLPNEYPNLVYVVARSHRHASVQMRNYGYAPKECNGTIRVYRYVDHVDQLRGLSGVTVWILDGVQYCACRYKSYIEIVELITALSNRYTTVLVPEIDSEKRIITRSIYDLRNS